MEASSATYGAYCIFDFRCQWFNEPQKPENLGFHLDTLTINNSEETHERIRNFVFQLGKPTTVSKKSD